MADRSPPGAAQYLPRKRSLATLQDALPKCRGCGLWRAATHAVLGEGPPHASLMLVGETPGNDEDLAGRPFVGPAGKLLNSALEDAELDREQLYVSNVVKHFKWEPRGKRRLHKRPSPQEIWACRPWLDAELDIVQPQAVVCLGATAAQALLGRSFRVTKQRGQLLPSPIARLVMATVHPASILRAPTPEERELERERFVADLRVIAAALRAQPMAASAR